MVFTTLLFGPGLSSAERARARRLVCTGFRATSAEQTNMVGRSGWNLIEQVDVTREYAETVRRDLHAYESRAALAGKILGASDFAERLARKHRYLHAIEGGLLRRELFVTSVLE